MRKRRISILVMGVMALTAACSGAQPGNGMAAGPSPAAPHTDDSLTLSTTLVQADARLHTLLADAIATASPKPTGLVVGGVIPPQGSLAPCTAAGNARHVVNVSRIAGAESPDIGPAVRTALASQGWTFDAWQSAAKPHPGYLFFSTGRLGDYTIKVSYRKHMGETDLFAWTPCLLGTPTSQTSMFPWSSASTG